MDLGPYHHLFLLLLNYSFSLYFNSIAIVSSFAEHKTFSFSVLFFSGGNPKISVHENVYLENTRRMKSIFLEKLLREVF